MSWPETSLRFKVTAIVCGLLLFIFSIYAYAITVSIRGNLIRQMENSAYILGQSLARSINNLEALENPNLLQKLVLDFNDLPGIHQVYVINRNYSIIAHPVSGKIGNKYSNDDVRDTLASGRVTTEYKERDGLRLYDLVVPIAREGVVLGAVEVELDTAPVNQLISTQLRRAFFVLGFTIVSLAVIMLLLLSSFVLYPIRRLSYYTEAVKSGEMIPVPVYHSKDELGKLGENLVEMIEALHRLEIRALESNPLTGMPGNLAINRVIENNLSNGIPFWLFYFDINNFKSYNDYYGFKHGDLVIQWLAQLLKPLGQDFNEQAEIVGHIGGDDFVVISLDVDPEAIARRVVEEFDVGVGSFYEEVDLRRGYIEVRGRQGRVEHFPFLSLAVAVLRADPAIISDPLALAEKTAKAKALVKQEGQGSRYRIWLRPPEEPLTGAEVLVK